MSRSPYPILWQPAPFAALPWLAHGVTERSGGGVSEISAYSSLNLGLHVGDVKEKVLENRQRAAQYLGFSRRQMVYGEQIHGGQAAVVTFEMAGRGADTISDALPGVDALVTDTPGLLLTLFYADCLPVLFADPVHRVIGVAHAGWKGIVAGIVENTLETMRSEFGTEARETLVAVGPGIGFCCFEVGPEVAERFEPDFVTYPVLGGNPHIDLSGAVTRRLTAAGVAEQNITFSGACTFCLPDRYFSHRRDEGRTGRMAAMIGIREAS